MNQLMKRVLSVLLVVCLLCSALPSAFAAEGGGFTDVSKDHWAYDAITEAVAAGYFKGVSDTAFDPEGTLTRAMLVTVLARAAGAETDDNASTGFSDVAVGTWYTGAVAWAAENGVVTGDGDGTFAPDRAATRQETATIFLRLLKLLNKTLPEIEEVKTFTDAADIAAWAEEAVETMQTAGVLTGYPDGSFLPQNPLTRAEAATLLCRFLKAAEDKTEPTEPTETEPTEPEPTEPEPTEPEPTEPKEPIHVTFVSEHSAAYVEGKAVTELTLPENVNFVEFIARADEGYEVYDVSATSGRLASHGSNYILAGLTEDVTVTLSDGLIQHTVTFNAVNGTTPVQVKVLPITDRCHDYAEKVVERLSDAGIRVEGGYRSEKLGYKIRDAQMQKIPYMLVVGDKEAESGNVSVRTRAGGDEGVMSVDDFMAKCLKEIAEKSRN